MRADVLVDLQFGSTGKGAVAAYLVNNQKYDASIRVQSVQAGHTVEYKGKAYKMRTIPCAWVNPDVALVLGPGCFINKELLLAEISMINGAMGGDVRDRLYVDFRAFYVTDGDVAEEVSRQIEAGMGSTAHGAGSSLIRKLWRADYKSNNGRVADDTWATDNGIKVIDSIHSLQKKVVLVEGCQGTMLSIHTSPYYPYVTTREATASGIAAECGIAPEDVRDVIGVFRSMPIRVGGNSGPTGSKELTWAEVNERCGREVVPERTTVTNRVRRIFEFNFDDFRHAIMVNKPTRLFMTFGDYLAPGLYKANDSIVKDVELQAVQAVADLVDRVDSMSNECGSRQCTAVEWVGTGEGAGDYITWPVRL